MIDSSSRSNQEDRLSSVGTPPEIPRPSAVHPGVIVQLACHCLQPCEHGDATEGEAGQTTSTVRQRVCRSCAFRPAESFPVRRPPPSQTASCPGPSPRCRLGSVSQMKMTRADTPRVWPRPAWPRVRHEARHLRPNVQQQPRQGCQSAGRRTTTAAEDQAYRKATARLTGTQDCAEVWPRHPLVALRTAGDLLHPRNSQGELRLSWMVVQNKQQSDGDRGRHQQRVRRQRRRRMNHRGALRAPVHPSDRTAAAGRPAGEAGGLSVPVSSPLAETVLTMRRLTANPGCRC